MMLAKGASPVPVDSSRRRDPGSRLSTISVPVGLRPTSTMSPRLMHCRREVSGPSGTLMLKNSSDPSWLALAML
jgi:hypothetical protein